MRPALSDGAGPRLWAVVVTFDRLAQLKVTVERLLASEPDLLAGVLVVDNASGDGTRDWLATLDDPRLEVLALPRNVGGAGGFEAGLRHAAAAGDADWFCLMDDDARPAPDAFARFHARPRDGRVAWFAAVRYPDGAICEMNRPLIDPFRTWKRLGATLLGGRETFHGGPELYEGDTPSDIDGGSFVGAFLSSRALDVAGFPDGRIFIYGDDTTYTLDLGRRAGPLGFDPGIVFEHDCGTAIAGAKTIRPLWKVFYLYRNRALVYRLAAGRIAGTAIFLAFTLVWLLRARHYGADRPAYLRLWRAAVGDGLRGRRGRDHADVSRLVSGSAPSR